MTKMTEKMMCQNSSKHMMNINSLTNYQNCAQNENITATWNPLFDDQLKISWKLILAKKTGPDPGRIKIL